MRKIGQDMVTAINFDKNFQRDNTMVVCNRHGADVYLHGNHIAHVDNGPMGSFKVTVNTETLMKYPTRTTLSRLRALGVDVHQKNYDIYLNGAIVE